MKPFKLHQFLNEHNWQTRQFALNMYQEFTLPSSTDCFYFSVFGAITHFYECRMKKGQAYREMLESQLNAYALTHFGMFWKDFEKAKGQTWNNVKKVLVELDI